jgi:hypothetical protein
MWRTELMRRAALVSAAVALFATGVPLRPAAEAKEGTGYKGIAWQTPCEDAISSLEATGVTFSRFNNGEPKAGFSAHAASSGPVYNAGWFLGNAWCPGNDAANTAAFGNASPYAEAAGSAGDVDFIAYCRDGKFVGVEMSAEGSSPEGARAVALLKKVAGPAVATNREIGTVHSVLKTKGDGARFLTVSKSLMDGIPSATYSVVDAAEWKILRDAYLKCSRDQADAEKQSDRRSRKQAQDVVE